jgi:hypothetical protein
MINPSSQLATYVSPLGKLGPGAEQEEQLTGIGALRVAQVDLSRAELARTGRFFTGGLTLVANAIVPVVDLPTTTAPFIIYNNAPSGGRSLILDRLSVTIGSGTTGAAGFSLFCGVTSAPVASPPTANSTGVSIQATRGFGTSVALGKASQTIPSGTAFMVVGGIMTTAVAVTGCGYSTTVDGGFIAAPGYGLVLGILGDTGTSAKYLVQATWAEIELDTP